MNDFNAVLNERIARVSRKQIKTQTGSVLRLTARYRRDIAALKREVAALARKVGFLQKVESRRGPEQPKAEAVEKMRFRADGLRTHRAKLGISAKDYGKLVGVSALTVYHWEGGKSRPRREQLAKLAAVRGLGKREALQRLGVAGDAKPGPRRISRGGTTAAEFVTELIKSRKATNSGDINRAWKASGRPGNADNTLSILVKVGKLKREKLKGQRGSRYRTA